MEPTPYTRAYELTLGLFVVLVNVGALPGPRAAHADAVRRSDAFHPHSPLRPSLQHAALQPQQFPDPRGPIEQSIQHRPIERLAKLPSTVSHDVNRSNCARSGFFALVDDSRMCYHSTNEQAPSGNAGQDLPNACPHLVGVAGCGSAFSPGWMPGRWRAGVHACASS